ncbi:MAG: hypothetical protein JXB49_15885 [Bacteroidales bacterium]|nr:hypothetical protein [Bacteroidales bacterium]
MSENIKFETKYSIGHLSYDSELKNYYQDISMAIMPEKINYFFGSLFDKKGVPLTDYDSVFKSSPYVSRNKKYGIHYTPVMIAQYALAHWGQYLVAKKQEYYERFLIQTNWLRDNIVMMPEGFGVWLHNFEFPIYKLTPPWISAMAQGQGISVMLRAYQITKDEQYFDIAQKAFNAFQFDINDCGVAAYDEDNLWLEEFPAKPFTHVLNGFIYALWGVLDFYRVTQSSEALVIWEKGIKTLRENLNKYEIAFWSCYDLLRKTICSIDYHQTHILQLKVMNQLTKEPIFGDYSERWQAYLNGKFLFRRLIMRKIRGLLRRSGILGQQPLVGISVGVKNR